MRETKTQINDIFEVLDVLMNKKIEQEKPRTPIGYVLKGVSE
jgi:hypothetical protein